MQLLSGSRVIPKAINSVLFTMVQVTIFLRSFQARKWRRCLFPAVVSLRFLRGLQDSRCGLVCGGGWVVFGVVFCVERRRFLWPGGVSVAGAPDFIAYW